MKATTLLFVMVFAFAAMGTGMAQEKTAWANGEPVVISGVDMSGYNKSTPISLLNESSTLTIGAGPTSSDKARFAVSSISVDVVPLQIERSKGWFGDIPEQAGDEKFKRIYIKNATLYHEDDSEVALWGANFQSAMSWELHRYENVVGRSVDMQEWKAITDRSFDEIQQMGCEVIRIHLCPGDFADSEGNLVENEWLDMVDYTIAECHRRGIYIYFTLINHLQKMGGVVNGAFIDYNDKKLRWELMVEPGKIAISENYIRQFVNRPNPYDNNRKYKHNPAWVIAEIINEPWWPTSPPQPGEYSVGRAVYEQWLCENRKADNDTSWDEFRYQKTKTYLNRMNALLYEEKVPAVPCWNLFWARGPIHQGWVSYDAAADSKMPVVSFGTYVGKMQTGGLEPPIDLTQTNMLPELQDSYDIDDWQGWARQDRFKNKKAQVVYEFNTNYNLSSYLYPAIARYFRAQGVQVATMWTYAMNGSSEHTGVSTLPTYLSMEGTPRKALGFLIGGEVYRSTPRYQPFNIDSADEHYYGNASLSFPQDLAAFSTESTFAHTGDVDSGFIAIPDNPSRIAGYGDSPFVSYDGKGAYFLNATSSNNWTLTVMPHAEPLTYSTTIDRTGIVPITLKLPGIDVSNFVYRMVDEALVPVSVRSPSLTFDVVPGDYLIRGASAAPSDEQSWFQKLFVN